MADDSFHLWQVAAGQRATSVCVDAGLGVATQLGLAKTSTRSDGAPDAGSVDVGYHYGVAELQEIYIPDIVRLVCPGFCRPEQIDCNGDGKLTIEELILAVNITLDRRSITACPSFDANDDGRVTIDELITGVRFTLS
ncbi:MAG: hypothetical protein A3J75_02460 [Acidobacteria bacterium RBG_16_68_9]|nr:MAG: hypothetical protein A3J75_02460 [Acidobacteria bacterium RBG_16_68_9]